MSDQTTQTLDAAAARFRAEVARLLAAGELFYREEAARSPGDHAGAVGQYDAAVACLEVPIAALDGTLARRYAKHRRQGESE